MRDLVLPFVRAAQEPREQRPNLHVYEYAADGLTMIPVAGSGSARVTDILLSAKTIDATRQNVRLRFDDVNDGTTVDPPVDYADLDELRGWTLRALDEWIDYVVPQLANRQEPEALFEGVYADFETRFFTESYVWMCIAPLANFTFEGSQIDLEDGLVIRYLDPAELNLRHQGFDDYRHHRHRPTPPRIALVQTALVEKGARVSLGNAVPMRRAVGIALFCIRVIRPGSVFSDELQVGKHTCWGLDSGESHFAETQQITSERGTSYLDRHSTANLATLWALARDHEDFNTRFLATKLQDNSGRNSLLDRFVDAAIVLQNIYGSEGARFASAMAWALRGHRDAAERRAVWEDARNINRSRNGILHGNKDLIRPLIEDLAEFQELTERAEEYMRQSLQLLLLNDGFRNRLDDAALGAEVSFKRLPFTF